MAKIVMYGNGSVQKDFRRIPGNDSTVSGLIVLGLPNRPEMQPLLFAIFLCIYLVAVMGNGLIVAAVSLSAALHTPMYLMLLTVALVYVVCTFSIVPKMLETMLGPRKSISYHGYMAQLYFATSSLGTEMVLFTAMAYDPCVAFCFPLLYAAIMSRGLILRIAALLALSCSPVWANDVMVFVADIALAMGDFLLTCLSYGFIVATMLCMRKAEVVSLYYSPVIYTYIQPTSSYSLDRDKVVVVTPTLNSIVYSLRNKEIQAGVREVLCSLKLRE
ncbi:olfactory receptor 13G1-like [Tachyglossus aculeatus]|uniref:olfactory receptor 13G1-like n=1 Tax=Tachyglossus aculeatus TaxID=9261 RepID=UPI0018F65FB3|nr:olfactory receptor 13G1-like [Tachyglossus aculeatus]